MGGMQQVRLLHPEVWWLFQRKAPCGWLNSKLTWYLADILSKVNRVSPRLREKLMIVSIANDNLWAFNQNRIWKTCSCQLECDDLPILKNISDKLTVILTRLIFFKKIFYNECVHFWKIWITQWTTILQMANAVLQNYAHVKKSIYVSTQQTNTF